MRDRVDLGVLFFVAIVFVWPCMDYVEVIDKSSQRHHERELQRLKVERMKIECAREGREVAPQGGT